MQKYTDEELDKMYQEEIGQRKRGFITILKAVGLYFGGQIMLGLLYLIFDPFIAILGFFVLLYVLVIYCKKNLRLSKLFGSMDVLHDQLIPDCVQDIFGEEAVYDKTVGIAGGRINNSHLVGKSWNTCHGKNLVKGVCQGISFSMSDVTLIDHSEYEDSDGNTQDHDVTVFAGQWAVLDFEKPFSTNLIVRERGEKLFDKWADGKSTVEMEDVEFNKKFVVIAEDAHNAFYLLTPQMMEHIIQAEQRFKGRIYFCFMDGQIHIAIDNGKSLFEGISMANGAAAERKRIRERLRLIPDLVEQMNL